MRREERKVQSASRFFKKPGTNVRKRHVKIGYTGGSHVGTGLHPRAAKGSRTTWGIPAGPAPACRSVGIGCSAGRSRAHVAQCQPSKTHLYSTDLEEALCLCRCAFDAGRLGVSASGSATGSVSAKEIALPRPGPWTKTKPPQIKSNNLK